MKFRKMKAVLLTTALTVGMAAPAYAAENPGNTGITYGEQTGVVNAFNTPFTEEEWQKIKAEVMAKDPNMTELLVESLRAEWEFDWDDAPDPEYERLEKEDNGSGEKIRLYKGDTAERNQWYEVNDVLYSWVHSDNEGYLYQNQWLNENGRWFYFGEDYYMSQGWKQIAGDWYFFVVHRTAPISGDRAFGEMTANQWLDFRYTYENTWYYVDASGKMVTGWEKINGKWYYFDENGRIKSGWLKDGDKWYYLDEYRDDYSMVTGWRQIKGTWYYFDESGAMLSNCTKKINGVNYTFSASGAWIK